MLVSHEFTQGQDKEGPFTFLLSLFNKQPRKYLTLVCVRHSVQKILTIYCLFVSFLSFCQFCFCCFLFQRIFGFSQEAAIILPGLRRILASQSSGEVREGEKDEKVFQITNQGDPVYQQTGRVNRHEEKTLFTLQYSNEHTTDNVPEKLKDSLFLIQFLTTKKIASNKCLETFLSFLHS